MNPPQVYPSFKINKIFKKENKNQLINWSLPWNIGNSDVNLVSLELSSVILELRHSLV